MNCQCVATYLQLPIKYTFLVDALQTNDNLAVHVKYIKYKCYIHGTSAIITCKDASQYNISYIYANVMNI